MAKLYKKRPATVEAMRAHPHADHGKRYDSAYEAQDGNLEVANWIKENGGEVESLGVDFICIKTLEGTMTGGRGGYVIRGTAGEFYPCKAEIFHAIYDPVVQ